MEFPSALLALIGITTAIEIQLKGTCDNAMTVWLSEDGSDSGYQELVGWSGNLNNWNELKSLTTDIPDLRAKIKIQCRNADNECQGTAGGLLFSVGFDNEWHSTNGGNNNNGYYTLVESKSGITTTVIPDYPWGHYMDLSDVSGWQWTWTCAGFNFWDCNNVCGEYNTYVFDFSTACTSIDAFTATTSIPTESTRFSYGGGASRDTSGGVVSIRSGNPGVEGTALSQYCFTSAQRMNSIALNYRFLFGYNKDWDTGVPPTFRLVISEYNTNNVLWQSDSIEPYYGSSDWRAAEAHFWYHGNGCNGCLVNYSPTQSIVFEGLSSSLTNKQLQFKFVFSNNARNMHVLQNDLAITVNWKLHEGWVTALTLGGADNSYNDKTADLGQAAFNRIFQDSHYHIIRRECSFCAEGHTTIYYRRLTNPNSFDAYSYMKSWRSQNNDMNNGDFILTSTLEDAIDRTNVWTACNYDDAPVGAFRDCGPSGLYGGQWTADKNAAYGGNKAVVFAIYSSTAFPVVLTLGGSDNKYNGQLVDVGQSAFNQIFHDSDYHIIRKQCASCDSDWKDIYYRRLSNPTSFNAYGYMKSWGSANNNMANGDFILTSTLEDAMARTNTWSQCNYDDPPVGAFRDCGPSGFRGGQWSADKDASYGGGKAAVFSIYTGSMYYDLNINSYQAVGKPEANSYQAVGKPEASVDEICKPCYGRGVGTIPAYCPHGYPDYDAGLCYPNCNAGYTGVGPVCWEQCDSGETDDGAFCRIPLITETKDSYGRGVGEPLGCSSDKEQDGALCYPRCNSGYYGVSFVCWAHCRGGYDDHGATCYKNIFNWYFKGSYTRGAGSVLDSCSGSAPDRDGLLCYPRCNDGYYGVGPVCWEHCDGVDRGALCETQSLSVRAKDSYGRGVGRVRDRCYDDEELDAGLCYEKCSDESIWEGVGPVCWRKNLGTALGVTFGTNSVKTYNMAACAMLVGPTIYYNIGQIIANPSHELTALDLQHFAYCLYPTIALTSEIDSKWSTDKVTVAFEIDVKGHGTGAFFGIAFNFPDLGSEDLDIYIYWGTASYIKTDAGVSGDLSMVIYRSPEDIPGKSIYFGLNVDIPETEIIGVGTTYVYNNECDVIGSAMSIGLSAGGHLPLDLEFGVCETEDLTLVYTHRSTRRRLDAAPKQNHRAPEPRQMPSLNGESCFHGVASKYYARCHAFQTIRNTNPKVASEMCLRGSNCIGYTMNSDTKTAQILSLTECSMNGVQFFDAGADDNTQAFYINRCLQKQQDSACDGGYCELKKTLAVSPIKSGQTINEYYAKCPFSVVTEVVLTDQSDDGWYNIWTLDANGDIPYPGLFVNYKSKQYKLEIGAYDCVSDESVATIGESITFQVSVQCNGGSTLKVNDEILCTISDYSLDDIASADGKTIEVFASDASYPAANGFIKSIKATKPNYIWNGYLNDDANANDEVIFNSIAGSEYVFDNNLLIAPYLQFAAPYSIDFDISVDVTGLESVMYNIFEIGFEDDFCTEINDIYLDFDNEFNALALKVSSLDATTVECTDHDAANVLSNMDWVNVKVLIQENGASLYVNNDRVCSIDTAINTHQEMVPLVFASSVRMFGMKGKFKNINVINQVNVDTLSSNAMQDFQFYDGDRYENDGYITIDPYVATFGLLLVFMFTICVSAYNIMVCTKSKVSKAPVSYIDTETDF